MLVKQLLQVGKGEDEVVKRQDDLRRLVKGVIPCDILHDPPLLVPGYEGPYDIIFSSLSLITCTTHEAAILGK